MNHDSKMSVVIGFTIIAKKDQKRISIRLTHEAARVYALTTVIIDGNVVVVHT